MPYVHLNDRLLAPTGILDNLKEIQSNLVKLRKKAADNPESKGEMTPTVQTTIFKIFRSL